MSDKTKLINKIMKNGYDLRMVDKGVQYFSKPIQYYTGAHWFVEISENNSTRIGVEYPTSEGWGSAKIEALSPSMLLNNLNLLETKTLAGIRELIG